MDENEVIALYGFRSKQEYIYRTNRMREITGASELIAGMYSRFTAESPVPIDADWRNCAWSELRETFDGAVVYEGGGNLCILYRDRPAYVRANRFFSRMILDCAPGLGLIAACVARTDDFGADMKSLRAAFDAAKNSHLTRCDKAGGWKRAGRILPRKRLQAGSLRVDGEREKVKRQVH